MNRAEPCFLGIDGGGTKTFLRAADAQGRVLAEATSGPSNLNAYSRDEVFASLDTLIREALGKLPENYQVRAACIGSAGISVPGASQFLQDTLIRLTHCQSVLVQGDMEIALTANLGSADKAGIIVISGTGAICHGRDGQGGKARSSGWGHVLSDEGSGYWIGLEGLRACLRAFDRRIGPTLLTGCLPAALGCDTPPALVRAVAEPSCTKAVVASLCKLVEDCAAQGDEAAQEILKRAAGELFTACCAVALALGLEDGFGVVMSGSVLLKCAPLRKEFEHLLCKAHPHAKPLAATENAAQGAVIEAIRLSRC